MYVPPYRISLSGGGIKGFAHIGALEVLQERGLLGAVKEYIGISAGALCAFCICIGCSFTDIRKMIARLDFGSIRDVGPETILNFPEEFGIDSGANLERLLGALLRGKGLAPNITFRELAGKRLGPALRVFATNLNRCVAEEFSAKKSPDTEVRFAVQASMSVPIYFIPVRHPQTGHLFLDGGIMSPSPFAHLSYEERLQTLAISFGDEYKPKDSIDNLYEFIYQLYYSLDYNASVSLAREWADNTIVVNCGRINIIDFEAGAETKEVIMNAGRSAAMKFLKTPGQRPVRRFSVS
jgi:predicted acylesterase/phospholipase RssA